MNTENSKTNETHRFRLSLADKLNLKSPNKNIALGSLSIYDTWKNIKLAYNNNKFKIFAPTWNDTFDLPDGHCGHSRLFWIYHQKTWNFNQNPPVQIYPNKIKKQDTN